MYFSRAEGISRHPSEMDGVVSRGLALPCLAWHGLAWPGLAGLGLDWPGLAWLGVSWPGLVWPGLAWLGWAWLGLARPGLAWRGLAWPGLARLGLAWLGLAWPEPPGRLLKNSPPEFLRTGPGLARIFLRTAGAGSYELENRVFTNSKRSS